MPFVDVLDAKAIEHAFDAEGGLFAQDDIFSSDVTLWAFLAQALRDGKGASCAAAVADITTYMTQIGQKPQGQRTLNTLRNKDFRKSATTESPGQTTAYFRKPLRGRVFFVRWPCQKPPAGDTGDYCRARAKVSLAALQNLVIESVG